jgi:hypothetical protein
MTISTISVISERIKTASGASPIAVFETNEKDLFDAVFAKTVLTERKIDMGDGGLIGVFFGDDGVRSFKDSIRI